LEKTHGREREAKGKPDQAQNPVSKGKTRFSKGTIVVQGKGGGRIIDCKIHLPFLTDRICP